MKKLSYILTVAIILMIGCNTNKLDEKTATELIVKKYQYPRVMDHYIFCSDPDHARMVSKSGLEEKGLVVVQRTQKLMDAGKPLVHFTVRAKPYLLSTSKEDTESHIQKVKIADEIFDAIKEIRIMSSGKKAIVIYSTVRKNTIFASVLKKSLPKTAEYTVYFVLTEDGWKLVNKSDIEFIAF
jgi:hypothetical protein